MRYSKLFGKTLRQVAKDITARSHQLLLQAGYIRESTAGRYYFLPLGLKVRERICHIIAEEVEALGAQKMITPVLHPLSLWQETKRDSGQSFGLTKVTDRRGAEFVLGGTAEEMLVDLVRKFDVSFRDLPFSLYQFSQKFRDELRARGGLLRAREFLMKDAYSFHRDKECLQEQYERWIKTYLRIFERLGLQALVVKADNGYMGGSRSDEFIVQHPEGESRFFTASGLDSAVHEDIADFVRKDRNPSEELLPLKKVDAPRGPAIADGVALYNQPAWRQIKTVVYVTDRGEEILAAIRGDLSINEPKLCKTLGCNDIRLATEDEVEALGSVIGFVSPLKLRIRKVGDTSLQTVRNFYTGADELKRDTLNVNYGRDFECEILTDIGLAEPGFEAPDGGGEYQESRGIEVGNTFILGTHYSEKMHGASFVDSDGQSYPFYMGCYGIGIGRTLATIAECHSDDHGLCWPEAVVPYQVHLIAIGKGEEVKRESELLYQTLQEKGITVLFDDRDISPGVKFADADLIGLPHRLVVSPRTLKGDYVEYRARRAEESEQKKLADIITLLRS